MYLLIDIAFSLWNTASHYLLFALRQDNFHSSVLCILYQSLKNIWAKSNTFFIVESLCFHGLCSSLHLRSRVESRCEIQ